MDITMKSCLVAVLTLSAATLVADDNATYRPFARGDALSTLPVACTPKTTVPGEAPSLLPDGHAFRLVWQDEFNGERLDETKWGYRTNFWGRAAHWFAKPEDGCVELRDGVVHLKVRKLPNGQFVSPQLQTGSVLWDTPAMTNPKGFWWVGKREKPKFVHCFGYYECRFRLQRKPGWWSAFWMQTETQGCCLDPARAGIEQDIMESFYPGEVSRHMFHYNGYGPDYEKFAIPFWATKATKGHQGALTMDTETFHTIGLLWEPDGYTVFVDGRRHGEKTGHAQGKPVSHTPQFLLLSTECMWYRHDRMTGPGVPELEAAAAAGDDFAVDFVRVYDLAD